MSRNEMVIARLELVAVKAKVLADDYKNNRLWEGDLGRALDELLREITAARNADKTGY
jgi:hypothetical protein